MLLWTVLTFMVAVAVSGLTFSLARRRDRDAAPESAASILAVQLAEVDSQRAAGDVSSDDAGALKTEIRRRILAEGNETESRVRPVATHALPWLAIGVAGCVALAATGLYAMLGRPELATVNRAAAQPAANARVNAASISADVAAMIAKLEARMRAKPSDPEGWRLLGWSYLVTGRAEQAAEAYARAVALAPRNADYRSSEGEALVRAADGQVTPSALEAFRGALKADPNDPRAKYYLAMYKDQSGDHDGAMTDWIALIRNAPPDAPWLPGVRRFVENTARARGLNIGSQLPPEPSGKPRGR